MGSDTSIDVFVSYRSRDRSKALKVAEGLKERDLKVWFDQWELASGTPFILEIDRIINSANAVVVLIGEAGFGPWQVTEMQLALKRFVEKSAIVIPTLLPGAPAQPDLPGFLSVIAWMDMRDGISRENLDALAKALLPDVKRDATPIPEKAPAMQLHELLNQAERRLIVLDHTLDKFSRSSDVVAALNAALARKVKLTFLQLNPKSRYAEAYQPYHELESSASNQHDDVLRFFRMMLRDLEAQHRANLEVLFTQYMPRFRTIIIDESVALYLYMYGTDITEIPDLYLPESTAPGLEALRRRIIQSTEQLIEAPEIISYIRHGSCYEHWEVSKLASWWNWRQEERLRHKVIHSFYIRYAAEFHIRFGDSLEREVSAHLDRMGGRTLVLGCGSGKEVSYIANVRPDDVVLGVDFSPLAIELAKTENKALADNFKIADFYDLQYLFTEQFDSVVANAAFVHLFLRDDIDELLQKIWEKMVPGGLFFFRGLYKEENGEPIDEEMHRSKVRWDEDRWFVYYSRTEMMIRCAQIGFQVLDDVTRDIAREYGYGEHALARICEKGFPHIKFSGVYWPTLLLRKPECIASSQESNSGKVLLY